MPTFTMSARAEAPVEEVWKLLHDPTMFPRWWAGVETVETAADGMYTMWPAGYPDFPMRQRLDATPGDRRVTISCLVSYLEFVWQLGADGDTTEIDVSVSIPETEAHRMASQQALVSDSLTRLATLAARAG